MSKAFDPRDYEPFSGWDNFKFTVGGIFVLALPLLLLALIALTLCALL